MGNVYDVLAKAEIKAAPKYFSNRLIVEQCENIHLHYRNIRVEFSNEEFLHFADQLYKAAIKLASIIGVHTQVRTIRIDQINPYNSTHPVNWENDNQYHREGIEIVKDLIRKGEQIRPILVKPNEDGTYQRMDGFKRYMAAKELGQSVIECYVQQDAVRGGQDGEPFTV